MNALKTILSTALVAASVGLVIGQPDIVSYEYFIDTDPGQGNGTVIDLPAEEQGISSLKSITIPSETMEALSDGLHKIGIRTKDANGDWSVAFVRRVLLGEETVLQPVPDIVAAEYFIDADPGQGNGTAIDLTGETGTSINISKSIPKETLEALPLGFHKILVRTQDADGDWSVAFNRQFKRIEAPTPESVDPKLARIEYQWLVDGSPVSDAISLIPETPAQTIDFMEVVDLSELPGGDVTAVLKMTPYDTLGQQGWPAFKTVEIVWRDDDGDGLPNQWEELYEGFDPQVANDSSVDSDNDGLTDREEFQYGTDPTNRDTDGDNVFDGAEITLADYGFDPAVDNGDILAKFETAASGTGVFANLVQDTIDGVVADPNTYNLFTETQVETAAQAARSFVNVSARVPVGGDDVVIPGFTILGDRKKLLIRAVGPKLADFGVDDPLPDPTIEIFQARFDGQPSDLLATVDNWTEGDVEAIKAATASTGAFPLEAVDDFQGGPRPTDDTASAATILELGLGVYTVVVRSADGAVGLVLVEAYEIDED